MKILYGVQGTGNGHIARARAMCQAFRQHTGVEVDFFFTGRDAEKYFSMEEFGDYQTRQGMSFSTAHGKVRYGKTAINNNMVCANSHLIDESRIHLNNIFYFELDYLSEKRVHIYGYNIDSL